MGAGRRALVLLLLWAGCGGKLPPPPPRSTNLELPIQAFRVENNGLRVVLVPDPKASQIQVTMRYRVGMIDEPAGQQGIAHLAEHLMFLPLTGTTRETLFDRLEATATWFNAVTKLETTSYVSRADPSRLADLLQLEGLRVGLRCATLTEEAFARERDVVRNELRQRAADRRIGAALIEAMYPAQHPYVRAAVADEEIAIVSAITRDQACRFIDAHYSPDNAVLIVSGNVTPAAVDEALGKLLGRVAKRPFAPPPAVTAALSGVPATRKVQLDEPMAIVAWPLDRDPAERARMRAVAAMIAAHLNAELEGTARVIEYGAAGAPVIGFEIKPGRDEAIDKAVEAADRAATAMQIWFRPEHFQRARVRAVHGLFARFEDGAERDEVLADHVFAGLDPVQSLSAEVQALERLSADEARELVRRRFGFAGATIVTFIPEDARAPVASARGPASDAAAPVSLEPQTHARHEPRVRADPAAAHAEAKRTLERDPLAGHRERTLGNGLRVILMPLTTVPTVEVRLVFPAGAIDEPEHERGVAYLAAHALSPRLEDAGVLTAFYTAGGFWDVTVGAERTTFAVRGLDMHVDVLLAGLERLVRNGMYGEHDSNEVARRAVAKLSRDDALAETWRAVLYGTDHPYTRAEDWRRAKLDKLDRRAVRRFHDAHYRPGSATLVVAGGFDPVVAERWIDYLFADWDGKATRPRAAARAALEPAALAKYDDAARQVAVQIALPAGRGSRAASLIAAAMIDAAVADVRKQLGASYGLYASLVEERLSTHIQIAGFVAAERAHDALALLRDRIGQLAGADDRAGSWFVAARRDVMARLSSITSGAYALANLAEAAIELGRPLAANVQTAEDARLLTLDQMADTLGAVELERAAILIRGPRDAVTRAYAAVGRTPRVITR